LQAKHFTAASVVAVFDVPGMRNEVVIWNNKTNNVRIT
jgi:hypothetical protein